MTPLDEMLADCEKATLHEALALGSPALQVLMQELTDALIRYTYNDQQLALSLVFGMFLGELEGKTVEFEKLRGQLLTYEDRLRIHNALARIAIRATLGARQAEAEMEAEATKGSVH